MIHKKIWLPLIVGLIAGSLTFGAYKTGAIPGGGQAVSLQEPKSSPVPNENKVGTVERENEKGETAESKTMGNTTNDTPNIESNTKESVEQQEQINTNNAIKKLIDSGNFVEAKGDIVYPQGKGIIVDKRITVALEGYRIIVDESSYSTGKYYAVADLTIFNISNLEYISSPSNYIIRDSNGYTYSPTSGANTRGDIAGDLKFKDSRRGEIAFYVPENETKLELHYNTGIDAVKTIRFAIDTNSLINPPLPK